MRSPPPTLLAFAALINPKNPYAPTSMKEAQDAARALGKEIHIVHASSADELDSVFATLSEMKADALLIAPDGLFIIRAPQVAALSVSYRLPASHERRAFPIIAISFCPSLPRLRASPPTPPVFHFEPVRRAPRAVGRVLPLRHDTFEPHLAGMGEDCSVPAFTLSLADLALAFPGAQLGHRRAAGHAGHRCASAEAPA
jgi:hypothetical protein